MGCGASRELDIEVSKAPGAASDKTILALAKAGSAEEETGQSGTSATGDRNDARPHLQEGANGALTAGDEEPAKHTSTGADGDMRSISEENSMPLHRDGKLGAQPSMNEATKTSPGHSGPGTLQRTTRERLTTQLSRKLSVAERDGSQLRPILSGGIMRGETNLQDLESGPYFGSYALQGRRKKMEDSAILAPCLVKCKAELGSAGTSLSRPLHDAIEDPSPLYTDANEPAGAKEDILHFFAVYDGHGGAVASRFCAKRLHHFFSARLHLLASLPPGAAPPAMPCQDGPAAETGGAEDEHVAAAGEKSASSLASSIQEDCFGPQTVDLRQLRPLTADMITDALEYAFLEAHERFCRKTAVELIGTTATVGVVSSTHIFVAFSGDSRAVLRKHGVAYPVTLDQKPERPDEAERIKAAGGNIYVTDGQRVEGILGMTRAIGDSALTTAGVTPLPEVTVLRRAPGDEMLVLASDGLWECVSNEVSVEAAHRCLELVAERGKGRNVGAKHAAKVLANHAFKKGSGDNITVLVLDLAGPDDRKPKTQSASEGKAGGGEPMDVDGG